MKFYSNLIIPYCIDLSMSDSNLQKYSQELLADVTGEILEIGFGTGLNLPHRSRSQSRDAKSCAITLRVLPFRAIAY